VLKTIIGVVLIIYGISSFIQSLRKTDSANALIHEGIIQDPKKTSRTLITISVVSITVGILLIV